MGDLILHRPQHPAELRLTRRTAGQRKEPTCIEDLTHARLGPQTFAGVTSLYPHDNPSTDGET